MQYAGLPCCSSSDHVQTADCHGHGNCILGLDANLTSQCQCDSPYEEPDCAVTKTTFVDWLEGTSWHALVFAVGIVVIGIILGVMSWHLWCRKSSVPLSGE